jgi:hypothetical protein
MSVKDEIAGEDACNGVEKNNKMDINLKTRNGCKG